MTNNIEQLIRLLFPIILLSAGFVSTVQSLPAQADDLSELKQAAASAYYTALPQSVRKIGQAEQFLFTVDDPSSVDSPIFPGCCLVLAQHTKEGTSIVWQYRLSENVMAGHPIWFGSKAEKDKSHIFIELNNGTCLTFLANGVTPPAQQKRFPMKSAHGELDLNLHQAFFSATFPNNNYGIFFDTYALLELDLIRGKTQTLFQLPDLPSNFMHYLAVQDLDGGGSTEIVGETSLAKIINGEAVHLPGTLRVWHSTSHGFQQIYVSAPQHHWAIESDAAPMGADKKPVIVASELSEVKGGIALFLHFYRWNGHAIQEIASSRGILPALGHDSYTLADLRGDGSNSVAVQFAGSDSKTRLAVLSLRHGKLIKNWESPPLIFGLRFGRPDHYSNTSKQEVPLINPDNGKLSLFKRIGGRYVGWEAMRLAEPPKEKPPK